MSQIDPATRVQPDRPDLPEGYGISHSMDGLLTWEWVRAQMSQSRNYWISTTRPDGRPHTMPVWGVWLDDQLVFGTDRKSVKALNLTVNPAVSAHTESGDDAVIIEGIVEEITDRETFKRYTAAIAAKYPGMPAEAEPDPGNITYAVRARTVFGFRERDFPNTATRWRFSTPRNDFPAG